MEQAFGQYPPTKTRCCASRHARSTPGACADGVVVRFQDARCGGPRSQNDYLEIASQFHTVLLSDVPQMFVRHASEARRFTWLVDVLYRRVKLIVSAAVLPEQLYTEGLLATSFRARSRPMEMQSAEYLALGHRTVDTHLHETLCLAGCPGLDGRGA